MSVIRPFPKRMPHTRHCTGNSIAIVGSGVVGRATGVGLQAKGHSVVFYDVAAECLARLRRQGLPASDVASLGADHDAYLISVPSPTVEGRVDVSCVEAAALTVGNAIRSHDGRPLIVVRSTVPPGTAETLVREALDRSRGRPAGASARPAHSHAGLPRCARRRSPAPPE